VGSCADDQAKIVTTIQQPLHELFLRRIAMFVGAQGGFLRNPRFWLAVVLLVALLIRVCLLSLPTDRVLAGLVDDDFFYYANTAWNIAAGHGSSFDDGMTTHNGFHPLYMTLLLMAVLAGVTKTGLIYVGISILIASSLAAIVLAYHIGAMLGNRWLALCAPVSLAVSSFYVHASFHGFETMLVLCLTLATVLACLKSRSAWEIGLWVGVTALARIDAGFLALPVALMLVMQGRKRDVAVVALVSFVVVSPWIYWSWSNFGSPVPLSSAVKSDGFSPSLIGPGAANFARALLFQTFGEGLSKPLSWLVTFLLGLVMLVVTGRKTRGVGWLVIYIVLAVIVYSAFSTPHLVKQNQRYLTPAIVITTILFFSRGIRASALVPVLLASILIVVEVGTYRKLLVDSQEPSYTSLGMTGVPDVLSEIAREDDVVGCFDSGSIGYFADRPVVNLDGLVNSEVVEMLRAPGQGTPQERYARYLHDKGITIMVGGSFYWPNYFPDLKTWEVLAPPMPYSNPDGEIVFLRIPGPE
jgi:hypothetical protein